MPGLTLWSPGPSAHFPHATPHPVTSLQLRSARQVLWEDRGEPSGGSFCGCWHSSQEWGRGTCVRWCEGSINCGLFPQGSWQGHALLALRFHRIRSVSWSMFQAAGMAAPVTQSHLRTPAISVWQVCRAASPAGHPWALGMGHKAREKMCLGGNPSPCRPMCLDSV